jgi:hypothetical protein
MQYPSPNISHASRTPCVMLSSSTVSRIGMRTYRSNRSLNLNPASSSHSKAKFKIRLTPRSMSSFTCSSVVSSGPKNRKLGRIVDTVKSGKASSVPEVIALAVSGEGRAVPGEGGRDRAERGVRGEGGKPAPHEGVGGGKCSDEEPKLPHPPGACTAETGGDMWFECASVRCEGERGGRKEALLVLWLTLGEGAGTPSVSDLLGTGRTVSFGKRSLERVSSFGRRGRLSFDRVSNLGNRCALSVPRVSMRGKRSAERVSSRPRLGALGRREGGLGGRVKPTADGAGEGEASASRSPCVRSMTFDIIGNGEWGRGAIVDTGPADGEAEAEAGEGSSSTGMGRERAAAAVSIWNSPPGFLPLFG